MKIIKTIFQLALGFALLCIAGLSFELISSLILNTSVSFFEKINWSWIILTFILLACLESESKKGRLIWASVVALVMCLMPGYNILYVFILIPIFYFVINILNNVKHSHV